MIMEDKKMYDMEQCKVFAFDILKDCNKDVFISI